MRRKTDFFTEEEKSTKIVMKTLQIHQMAYKEDKKRQELIKEK